MHRRTTIRSIVRIILFVNLLSATYIFTCSLQKQDNPLLTFLTVGTIFAFLLVLLNPHFGRYTSDMQNVPTTLLLILILAFQVLARLFVLSYADNVDLVSLITLGIIAAGLISSLIAFLITKIIYTEKEGLLTVFLMTLNPLHVYLGNGNLAYFIAETMILMSVLLVLYSFMHNSKTFALLTTICASIAFISASTLNFAYMLMVFPFCFFYLLKCIDRIRSSSYALRFLYFFGTSGLVVAISLLVDEMIGTSFWDVIKLNNVTGSSAYEKISEVSSRITEIWGGSINTGNDTINYISSVLFVLLIFSLIAGIFNAMKDLLIEYVLIATYPLILTTAYIFMPFDNKTILAATPFIAITASFGITGAFAFIPASLKEYHTTLKTKPDIEIQLDDSFTLPGRWGPILSVDVKESTEQLLYSTENDNDMEKEPAIPNSDQYDENLDPMLDEMETTNWSEQNTENTEQLEVQEKVQDIHTEEVDEEQAGDNDVLEILEFSVPEIEEKEEKTELEKVYEMFDVSVPKRSIKNDDFDNISFSATNIYPKEDSGYSEKKFTLKRAYINSGLKFSKEDSKVDSEETGNTIDAMVDMLFENKNDKKRKK